jgi:hypothetical protein
MKCEDEKAVIRARNDALRARIPFIAPPDLLTATAGVAALGNKALFEILGKVKAFDAFTEGDDPYAEHDFGCFEHEGRKLYWKIDDHGGRDGYRLVLTVMLAEEY